MIYQDRADAGRVLGNALKLKGISADCVVAIPRGGIVVGLEIAKMMKVGLDVIVVRKVGTGLNPELGIGAVSEGGVEVVDYELVKMMEIGQVELEKLFESEKIELNRRIAKYRTGMGLEYLTGKRIIVVDDGMATGITMQAAVLSLRKIGGKQILVAIPVAAESAVLVCEKLVDGIICERVSNELTAVGEFYRDFSQITDEQVIECLTEGRLLTSREQTS